MSMIHNETGETKSARSAHAKRNGGFHALAKVDGGYKLRDHSTGKVGMYSKKPQSKAKALSQLRAIEYFKHGGAR